MAAPPAQPRTFVYVDGFNLYYGCLKHKPFKWLDLDALCRLLLPQNDVQRIKYFTARVAPRPGDPTQAVRQQTYLRALGTIPHLEVVLGRFLSHEAKMVEAPVTHPPRYVWVQKTEEKGSDVNLAAHLLDDAHRARFDVAVVVTNDSDLLMPIQMVRAMGLKVGILNPHPKPSWVLNQNRDFMKTIRSGVLGASRFPVQMQDAAGTFHKPGGW